MTATSPFDPLARLEPGEDRFTIREKDPVGPEVLTFWAHMRRNLLIKRYGTAPTGDAKRLYDAEIVQCAEADAKALDWRERQRGGEAEEGQRSTYVDAQLSTEQVAAAKRQKLHADLVQHLREADYAAHELLALDGPSATAEDAERAEAIHSLATTAALPRSEAA